MSEFEESLLELEDFLHTDPDSWRFDGLSNEEKEEAYWELRGVRRVLQEGRDYISASGIEEFDPAWGAEEQVPFEFEAERRLREFQERYFLKIENYELVINKRDM